MPFFPIDASVVHYWAFDEASGNTAADLIAGGTPMNPLDALVPPIIQSTFGNARSYVGSNSAQMCAPLTQFEVDYLRNTANPFVIELIGCTNDPGFASSLFGIDTRDTTSSHLYLQWLMQNEGRRNYLVQGDIVPGGSLSSGNEAFPQTNPPATLMHALRREVNAGGTQARLKIYCRGILVYTSAWVDVLVASDIPGNAGGYRYFMGRGHGGQWGWGGPLDECCVTLGDRDDAEIALRAVGGAGGASSDPPVISNVTPAPGSQLLKNAPIGADVTDDGDFSRVIVVVEFATLGTKEVVHDGDGFSANYSGSSRTAIANGWRYSVVRTGGWPASPTLRVFAIDADGQEAA